MALKYSLDLDTYADDIDKAVKSVLKDGFRTPDIMEPGKKKVSTSEMGSAIIEKLK
jgi:3-isopropylmalate dehydrogenase